jgi:hypothetical protein
VPAGQPGVAASATAPALPPVDAADGRLRYTQQGRTVTASLNGTTVATVALASWSWSGNSGSVLLTVTATRPLTLAPDGLFVDGADGHNEISPKNLRPIAVATGQQQVRLQFTGQGAPTGLSWVMDGPQDADGDGFVGTWELRAADRTG